MSYAQVVFAIPLDAIYDYIIPLDLEPIVTPGVRVRAPFGKRYSIGFCIGVSQSTKVEQKKLKKIQSVLDSEPVFDSTMIKFATWWSKYYSCSLGEALSASLPSEIESKKTKSISFISLITKPAQERESIQKRFTSQAKILELLEQNNGILPREEIRKKLNISLSPIKSLEKKGFVETIQKEVDPFERLESKQYEKFKLTNDQQKNFSQLLYFINKEEFKAVLLYGITGSGKTEIYMRVIEEVVKKGKEAIVLVPEIALTPQTVLRFKQRFSRIAVLHSELSKNQRAKEWNNIHKGKVQVVIGPRSALFAPTHNLGIIIVDEEHEPSFKQQNTPRYHARDLAVKRAQLTNALVILGSATPSLETFYNCLRKKYDICHLPSRIGNAKLPRCIVIDMKEECREQKRFVYFSRVLVREIRKKLEKKEQIILFLNRRGFARTVSCPACGFQMKCEHCDIALTYHKKRNIALCHYCNYQTIAPDNCPICQFHGIRFIGLGTERLETAITSLFPKARLARMDSDTMTTRQRYEETFLRFSKGEIDILLGTQMIAKGLDFPRVTLVGIISADSSLQLPDFRAAERTFQLCVQVSGRAGRAEKSGLVVLQSYHPEHYAISTAITQKYETFAETELKLRKQTGYPPFSKLLRVILEGLDEDKVKKKASELVTPLFGGPFELLGPAPAPITRIKDRYRWHFIVKSNKTNIIANCVKKIKPLTSSHHVKISIDIDPVNLL